ncbi:Hypothetical protein GL50581_4155 [Giardia duodenalis ATCC 50581]|uniref:CDC45-like protein n=2 Tax=Giardia intestinalis TaxID=5741 RepID=C6LZC4_GIAIB|nr:Hypothetical protein GL50581_4155 [Giardia intestinalis ATCC 50581]
MLLDGFQFHSHMKEFSNVTVAFSLDVDALASVALLRLFFRMYHTPFSVYPIYTDSHLSSFLERLSKMSSIRTDAGNRVVMLVNLGAAQDLTQYSSLYIYVIDYLRPASLSNVVSQTVFLFDEGMILGSLLLSFFPQKAARILHETMVSIHADRARESVNAPHTPKNEAEVIDTIGTKSYRRTEPQGADDPGNISVQDQSLSHNHSDETSESVDVPQHHPFDGSNTDSIAIPVVPPRERLGLPLDESVSQAAPAHDEPEYSDSVNKESTEESLHSSFFREGALSFVSDDTHLTDVSMGAAHRQVDMLLRDADLFRPDRARHSLDVSLSEQIGPSEDLDRSQQSVTREDDDGQDAVAAAFALLREKTASMSSMTELATLRVLYHKLSAEDVDHMYRFLLNILSHPSPEQTVMITEYLKLQAVASPSAVLLYSILSTEAKTGLSVSRSLMVAIQWHAMTGAAGAFILQRCSLDTVKELLVSCINTLQLREKQFTNAVKLSQYTVGSKSLSLDEVIASSQRNNPAETQVYAPKFTINSDTEPSAGSAAGNEDPAHSTLSQSSRLSSLLNTNDNGASLTKSMRASLALHDPLPYAVLNDPFLYCLRVTSLYNALCFTNNSLLRSVFDSYVSNRKSLQTATTANMASFFCNINGFSSDLYQKSWSEQDNNARFFILAQYTASIKKTSAPWRSIPFVPNMVYTTETNVEISAFDVAHLLEGLMMLLPFDPSTGDDGAEESVKQEPIISADLTHAQLLMTIYKCAFASPDEFLELSTTRKFATILHQIFDIRSEILQHAQRAYLSYRQRYRKIDPVPGFHVADLPVASLNHSTLYITRVVAEFRLFCVHRHLASLSRSPISFRFRRGYKDLQLIIPSVSSRDAERWKRYTHISPKQSFSDVLQRQSVVLVFKGPDSALVSGASIRLSLFDAWLANSLPAIREILTKKGIFTESCIEHSASVVSVPLQAAFTILPVIKGFMAAKMGEENAGVKRMLDQRETSKSKQELGTGNEGEPVGQQETEADDIDADVDQ